MPTTVPGLSIPEATKVLQVQDQWLTTFPEVERVFGKMGKAPTATDPAFVGMAIFLGILLLGLFYIWKKGALEWE